MRRKDILIISAILIIIAFGAVFAIYYGINGGNIFSKVKEEILHDVQSFKDDIEMRQTSGTSSINSALTEFNTWKDQLNYQLDQSNQVFNQKIESLKENADRKIADATSFLEDNLKTYTESFDKQQTVISENIESLEGKTEKSLQEYEERATQIIEQLSSMYTQMLQDTEDRVRTQNADSSRKLTELSNELQSISEKNRNEQSSLIMKMQGDANAMQGTMNSLSKELESIRSQMQIYDKASQLKKELDSKIELLEEDFDRIDSYKKIAQNLNTQYNELCKMKESFESRVDDFEKEKAKIESIEHKYTQMMNASANIDEKIRQLSNTNDELQNMEISVRDLKDSVSDVSNRYSRLEQKHEVLDRVNKDVDAAFENLKNLEDRLKDCERQSSTLPDEIRVVQKNVDELLRSGPKIGDAIAKLENMQELLKDADKRLETINSTRQGINLQEQRLQQLSKSVDSKFDDLKAITRSEIEKNPSVDGKHVTPAQRSSVRTLKRQGWTTAEIAKQLKLSQMEVELILEVPSDEL